MKDKFLKLIILLSKVYFLLIFLLLPFYFFKFYVSDPQGFSQYQNVKHLPKQRLVTPILLGVIGDTITPREKVMFEKANPFGFMLSYTNFSDAAHLKNLTSQLTQLFPDRKVYICLDQEGGAVDKIGNIQAFGTPSARYYGKLAQKNLEQAKKKMFEDIYKMSLELKSLGVNCNFAPVLDLDFKKADRLNASRFYSRDPKIVIALAEVFIEASAKAGVLAAPKHIPGHGRASDTHKGSAKVAATLKEMENSDFLTFKHFKTKSKMMMMNHIIYSAIDSKHPATFSKKVVEVIRNDIGFDGLLVTDALNMKPLDKFTMQEKVKFSFLAGVDVVIPHYLDVNLRIESIEAIDPQVIIKFNEKIRRLKLI